MRYVTTRLVHARALLAVWQQEARTAPIRVGNRRGKLRPGEDLIVEFRCPELAAPMLMRGTVTAWLGTQSGRVEVAFAEREEAKRRYLSALADGGSRSLRRRCPDRRFPIDASVEVHLLGSGRAIRATVIDVSLRGARLGVHGAFAVGGSILLTIRSETTPALPPIAARVVWARRSGGGREVGVEFRARDVAGERRTREIVRRLVLPQLEDAPSAGTLGLGPK